MKPAAIAIAAISLLATGAIAHKTPNLRAGAFVKDEACKESGRANKWMGSCDDVTCCDSFAQCNYIGSGASACEVTADKTPDRKSVV